MKKKFTAMQIQAFWDVMLQLDDCSKSWFIQYWLISKAVLRRNLQRPITFHHSIYWQHTAQILKVKKQKLIKKTIYRVNLRKGTIMTVTACVSWYLVGIFTPNTHHVMYIVMKGSTVHLGKQDRISSHKLYGGQVA